MSTTMCDTCSFVIGFTIGFGIAPSVFLTCINLN